MNYKRLLIIGLILVAIIWLPTFTPEDIPTTFFLISIFGLKVWVIVGLFLIFLLWHFGAIQTLKSMLK